MKVEQPADEMQGRRAGDIAEWSAAGEEAMGGRRWCSQGRRGSVQRAVGSRRGGRRRGQRQRGERRRVCGVGLAEEMLVRDTGWTADPRSLGSLAEAGAN
jgi:hypothetical protein